HYQILLEGIVTNPEQRISQLPLLTDDERQALIEWNETAVDHRSMATVHELFEEQSKRTPDSVAIVFAGARLSYRELNTKSNQMARYLRRLGVGPERLVGICMERSAATIISILGVLKAGGAYLPLDPFGPTERLRFMVADSGAMVVITQDKWRESGEFPESQVLCFDDECEEISKELEAKLDSEVMPENAAYVIYTSGSTGRPKGVVVEHRNLSHYLNWCTQAYIDRDGSGAPVQSSISVDLTVTSLFAPLLIGQSVELLDERDGIEALSSALQAERGFTFIKITPTQLELLSKQLQPHEASRCTRAFIIGGENLTGESLKFWQKHAPGTKL